MWVFGIKLEVQLVTGEVETNPGPIVGQDKIDQLQSHVKKPKASTTLQKATIKKLVI